MPDIPSFKTFYDRKADRDRESLNQQQNSFAGDNKSKAEQTTELTPNTKTRQQQPGGMTRATHLVPHQHQVKPHHITDVEDMRDQPRWSNTGRDLDQRELDRVLSTYGITDLAPDAPKVLGNSNMMLVHNPQTNKYRIEKR